MAELDLKSKNNPVEIVFGAGFELLVSGELIRSDEPELPLTFPVTFPVTLPVTLPERLPLKVLALTLTACTDLMGFP